MGYIFEHIWTGNINTSGHIIGLQGDGYNTEDFSSDWCYKSQSRLVFHGVSGVPKVKSAKMGFCINRKFWRKPDIFSLNSVKNKRILGVIRLKAVLRAKKLRNSSSIWPFKKLRMSVMRAVYTPPHPLGDKPLGDRALLIGWKSRDQRLLTLISADSVAPNT